MPKDQMEEPGKSGQAPGQDKTHTITNPTTGESRMITQREWREQGRDLRDQGFVRDDGVTDDEEPI